MFFLRSSSHSSRITCLLAVAITAAMQAQTPEPEAGLINRDASAFSTKTSKLYLLDTAHDAVTVISPEGQARSIQVGTHPDAIVINDRAGNVYVVNPGSRNVSIIDSSTDAVTATVATAARPYAIAVDEVANRVYVSNTFSSMLTVIDGATTTATNLKVGSADVILVDSDRQRVYLLGYESDTLTELNPADGSTSKIPAGAMHLWGLARSGRTLYVSHVQDSSIAAIDLETHKLRTIATGVMPCAIVINPTRNELYVANYADGTVTLIANEAPVATVKVRPHPQGLTLDPVRNRLYVASPQENRVDVIDLAKRRIIQSIDLGSDHPYAVAVQPQSHAAYTVNISRNSFTSLKGH